MRSTTSDAAVLTTDLPGELARVTGQATLPPGDVPGTHVLAPRSGEDVGAAIRLAVAHGVGLYPRSSTGPARLGRSRPEGPGVVVDLSGMDGVLHVEPRERVAIVEPGVTFAALQGVLSPHGLRTGRPLLPPAGKSALAAALDREPALVPKYHWDFTDPMLCAELYLGTGDRFRTGGAAGPGRTLEEQWAAGMHQKNPLGPAQTDIGKLVQGAQGTLGIATWVSLRLEPAPVLRRVLLATADDLAPLARFVLAATRRRLGDEILVFDAGQVAALSAALGVAAAHVGMGRWALAYVVGSLALLPEESMGFQLAESVELAAEAGMDLVDVTEADGRAWVDAVTGLDPGPGYWKDRPAGAFREVQFLTHLTRAGDLAAFARSRWEGLGVDAGDVGVYVQPVNQGRTCHVEVSAFVTGDVAARVDSDLPGLVEALAGAGAFFSRPYGPAVAAAYRRCPDAVAALGVVKGILDPAGIFAPGRLWTAPEITA